ncbi:MAG: thioredoxin family protein [Bacteroidales bacterium]|nr:thioredoxin family protein [Bacteroidales bacterium]
MLTFFKRISAILAATLLWSVAAFSQAPDATATWKVTSSDLGSGLYELTFTASIESGWHIYTTDNKYNPTELELDSPAGYSPVGVLTQVTEPSTFQGDQVFFDRAVFTQRIQLEGNEATVKGELTWSGCNDQFCAAPEHFEFSIPLSPGSAAQAAPNHATLGATPPEDNLSSAPYASRPSRVNVRGEELSSGEASGKESGSLWALIIEAILWGFAMLLTPCVFPMVPMTISFFMKQSQSPAEGRFKAFMYGLFIVLLYTVPISIIIGLTWLIGGNAVTADIFNWLATHWLPNIIFFIVFMVFAASFFGAFEIELPSSLANKSDAKAGKGGLGGIFFMALTLVLVSFSCTGPIVGTVLIKSTAGEFWTPMVTMLAFSVAFALPFTILAMFPSLLKKMKSGSWLNSVKVVLGFIEVALGFKFLSVADQTYHWGLLDREVYLAIWIVVFSLLGLYLLGKLRFKNDSPLEHISVTRLSLAIAVFSFVVYMIPGMWGAPLKALSGYLPPIETQDFIVWNYADSPMTVTSGDNLPSAPYASRPIRTNVRGGELSPDGTTSSGFAEKYNLRLPMGYNGYFTIEDGIAASKATGKPIFVDITGHGCVNCREMEQRVWSDPKVQDIMKNDYIMVFLYNDDKTKLEKEDWVTTTEGKTLKDIGRVNSYIVRERFNVNAQPNYALLDSEGELLVPVRGYNLSVEGFIDFLESGLEKFRQS